MAEVPTITVDLDAKCWRCKKPGAVNDGLCMNCVLRIIDPKFLQIRPRKVRT